MTSYFWSGFPSLSGRPRRDVWTTAYWRGHPPNYVTPIGSWTLTLSSFLSYKPLSKPSPCALRYIARPPRLRTSFSLLCTRRSLTGTWWGTVVSNGMGYLCDRRMMIDFGSCVKSLINSSLGTETYPARINDFPVFLLVEQRNVKIWSFNVHQY